MKEAILCVVKGLRRMGMDNDRIIEMLKESYGFSMEEAGK